MVFAFCAGYYLALADRVGPLLLSAVRTFFCMVSSSCRSLCNRAPVGLHRYFCYGFSLMAGQGKISECLIELYSPFPLLSSSLPKRPSGRPRSRREAQNSQTGLGRDEEDWVQVADLTIFFFEDLTNFCLPLWDPARPQGFLSRAGGRWAQI